MRVKPGIEQFMARLGRLVGNGKIGLVTNPSAVDSRLRSTLDLLVATGRVGALFGLEHGVRGHAQAGHPVPASFDQKTGLRVFSLYGDLKKPTADMLKGIDCLVFDIQDVGSRFYTYLYSLLYLLEAAAQFNLPIYVLDRPNPLGGEIVSGNILNEEYISFVGYPLPIRYGLTIGELALYFNETRGIGAELKVLELKGWQRGYHWQQTGLSWVPPSPNIPTAETALIYPGACLLEGTNLSEGRGTTKPFELVGAPWLDGETLAKKLNALNLPGVIFRPAYFTPTFSKHQGELCKGVQLHLTDRGSFAPITTTIRLLETVATDYEKFSFLPPQNHRYFFDLLAGGRDLRQLLTARDKQGINALLQEWDVQSSRFAFNRRQFFLY